MSDNKAFVTLCIAGMITACVMLWIRNSGKEKKDYQVEVQKNGKAVIYDGNRSIGQFNLSDSSSVSKMILEDNE